VVTPLAARVSRPLVNQARKDLRRGNYAAALGSLSRAVEENPGYADVRNDLGVALHLAGRSEQALAQFREALAINPQYAEVHLNQALVLNDLGRLDEARVSFERAAQAEELPGDSLSRALKSRLANLHAQLGQVYGESGRHGQAVTEFRRALALAPGFLDIRLRLAHSYLKLGRTTLAASEFGKVLAQNPGSLAARVGLGLVHFRRREREAARRIWEECRDLAPEDPAVKVYIGLV
jgi:tetratricopeptide (TPR) repeat protein